MVIAYGRAVWRLYLYIPYRGKPPQGTLGCWSLATPRAPEQLNYLLMDFIGQFGNVLNGLVTH